MTSLFLVVNVDWFFLSHRLPIALEAKRRGFDVTVLAIEEEGKGEEIRSHDLKFIPLPSTRGGMNILEDLKLISFLAKVYKAHKPDIIHHVAIKPVIYGSIAARYSGMKNVINAISGLGSMFVENELVSFKTRLLKILYRYSFNYSPIKAIVQNMDDWNMLQRITRIPTENLRLVKGSGVDLNDYNFSKEPDGKPIVFLLVGRMLWDKGISEYVGAAQVLKRKYGDDIKFLLVGKNDPQNVTSIIEKQLLSWNKEGAIEWLGFRKDIKELNESCHVAVLPSYREGTPKSLLEAMAIGRPIITTDVPGCREVVSASEMSNGILVKVRDRDALVIAMEKLFLSKPQRVSMGKKGREMVERQFSLEKVLRDTFDIYAESINTPKIAAY